MLLLPQGDQPPEYCPRCSSRLSLLEVERDLKITNAALQRGVARQAARQAAAKDNADDGEEAAAS